MLIHICDRFCRLYDLRFQKSFGENFSCQVQGHSKVIQGQSQKNSVTFMFIDLLLSISRSRLDLYLFGRNVIMSKAFPHILFV